jgi:hypothetical protein
MNASQLFLLIIFTALALFLFIGGIPELCAVAIVISIVCVIGWHDLIQRISKW